MSKSSILLTAFRGTSSEVLIKGLSEYKTVTLPNDKIKDSEITCTAISDGKTDYVICFGQRPVLKDKVTFELTARESDAVIDTDYPYCELKSCFEKCGIPVKISHNAGTSFCNKLYFNLMKFMSENRLHTKAIFIHIPMLKNITEPNAFFEKIEEALNTITFE